MANKQWQGTTGGGNFGHNSLVFLFRIFNVKIGYVFLALVVPFYMLFAHQGYKSIYHYFRKRQHFSVYKSFIHTYRNHFLFGQMMLDRFAVYAGKSAIFTTELDGNELFEQTVNNNKSVLIANSHIGNAEISGYLLPHEKTINTIIYGGENANLQQKRNMFFANNNIKPIVVTPDDLSHIFAINAAINRGELVNMACDRIFTGNKTHSYDFLGTEALFPIGAFYIAAQFQMPILCLFVIKTGWTKYSVFIRKIDVQSSDNKMNDAKKLGQSYVMELEKIVTKYPDQWFNFYNFWSK